MKKIFVVLCFSFWGVALQAQNEILRVAVLDPTTSGIAIDGGTKLAVRELISSSIVNTGRYDIIERSMIERIIQEQSFQNSDLADNSQATKIGQLAGANKVVLSAISLVGGRNMLSIKLIDVETARIDRQKTKVVSSEELLDVVEPLTLELLGEDVQYKKKNTSGNTNNPGNTQQDMVFVVEGPEDSYNHLRVVNETSLESLKCRVVVLNEDKSIKEIYSGFEFKERGATLKGKKGITRGTVLGVQFPKELTEKPSFSVEYKDFPMFDLVVIHLKDVNTGYEEEY
jgi:hypothetical protein